MTPDAGKAHPCWKCWIIFIEGMYLIPDVLALSRSTNDHPFQFEVPLQHEKIQLVPPEFPEY